MRKILLVLFLGLLVSFFPVELPSLYTSSGYTDAESLVANAAEVCGADNAVLRSCNLAERISNPDGFVFQSWVVMRNIINVVLILALIAISFTNIVRINIDTYTVKKALPKLLMGVVLANASLFIIRYLADTVTVVTYFFVEQANFLKVAEYTFKDFITDTTTKLGLETIINSTNFLFGAGPSIAIILILVIGLIIALGILWLAIILYVRLAMVYLLTILSPLVFIGYGIPGIGDKFFRQWWQLFVKWLFMLPAMSAIFWLILLVGRTGEGSIMQVIIMYVLFFIALSLPMKWGGSVLGKTMDGIKNAGGLAYKASQAGGANLGLKGMGLEGKGKSMATKADLAREESRKMYKGTKKGTAERRIAVSKRLEAIAKMKEAKKKQLQGKRLQGIGKTLTTPTSLQEGYKARIAAQRKGRELFTESSGLYGKVAGDDTVYGLKRKKAKEENEGLSKELLQEKMGAFLEENGGIKDSLLKMDKDTRNTVLFGSPFKSGATAQNWGIKGEELGNLAEYVEMYKSFELDRRRSRRGRNRLEWGEDMAQGFPTELDNRQDRRNQENVSGLNTNTINSRELDLKMHFDHIKTEFGPETAADIAKLGAALHDELNDAIEKGGDAEINRAIEKSENFFKTSVGYPITPPRGGEPSQQAENIVEKVSKITQSADAVSRGININQAAQTNTLFYQTAGQIEKNIPADLSSDERARHIMSDSSVGQVINNHITQQAKIYGNTLDQAQLQEIGNTVKKGLFQDLTDKKTLNRIFSSEKFQQGISNAIGQYAPPTSSTDQGAQSASTTETEEDDDDDGYNY